MHAWISITKNVQLTQEFYLIMALVSFGQFRIDFLINNNAYFNQNHDQEMKSNALLSHLK